MGQQVPWRRIAIVGCVGVLAASAVGAAASTLGTVDTGGVGLTTQVVAPCQTNGNQVNIFWPGTINFVPYSAPVAPHFTVSSMRITGLNSTVAAGGCRGLPYRIAISGFSNELLLESSGTVPSGNLDVNTSSLNVSKVARVSVVIYA